MIVYHIGFNSIFSIAIKFITSHGFKNYRPYIQMLQNMVLKSWLVHQLMSLNVCTMSVARYSSRYLRVTGHITFIGITTLFMPHHYGWAEPSSRYNVILILVNWIKVMLQSNIIHIITIHLSFIIKKTNDNFQLNFIKIFGISFSVLPIM